MKKALSMILCIAITIAVFADCLAFAGGALQSIPFYDPESLLKLLPQTQNQLNLPGGSGPMIPQIPSAPSAGSAGDIVLPARNVKNPPVMKSTEECPVDEASGELILRNTDLSLNGIGLNLTIERNYSSGKIDDGPFGIGWSYNHESILRMYSAYNMGEVRINGSTREYVFVKDDPDAYVTSYDGDSMTNYQLDKGHYNAAKGDVLERVGRYQYVVTAKTGEKYTYYGYQAPWRSGQDKREGKLLKYEDIFGNSISYLYDSEGQPVEITDTAGRR